LRVKDSLKGDIRREGKCEVRGCGNLLMLGRVWGRDFHLHHVEKVVSVRHYLKKVNKLFILFF
jgi:hypothetical protein